MVGVRPSASYYGTAMIWDSHGVNKLTAKHLRTEMPPGDLLLPSWCLQHLTGNTCTAVTQFLNISTRVWTLCKTFSEGDFFLDLQKKCHALLDDSGEGLEVVDPEISQPGPNDLREDFTRAVMDSCYGPRPDSIVTEEDERRWHREKEEFCKFFPHGQNRVRHLHPCPPGCCGPTACQDRTKSLKKAKELVDKVILRKICQPAQNKWTKLDPAFNLATLIVVFFALVIHALEQKTKMTYEALEALGQAGLAAHLANPLGGDDQAQEYQESFKGAMRRFGKRCLAFIGDPDSKIYLLVWKAVGSTVMAIRYRIFEHCTWHSHSKDDVDRLRLVDFCPGAEGRFQRILPRWL